MQYSISRFKICQKQNEIKRLFDIVNEDICFHDFKCICLIIYLEENWEKSEMNY